MLSAAGWSNMNTFAQFYSKPIQDNVKNFGQELLKDGHDFWLLIKLSFA